MIKFQQSQALTSHFESFWSIVQDLCWTISEISNFQSWQHWKGISSLTFLFGQTCCCCSVQNFCKNTLSWETFLPIRCKICCCYLNYNFKVFEEKKPRKCKTIFLKNMRYLWKRGKNITFFNVALLVRRTYFNSNIEHFWHRL